ncbi:putative reverse transcriptase domain-containing protein [Tanacetum coccineum]
MAPKRTTRSTPVTPTPNATTTTTVTEAQLQALIDQGVAAAMAEAEASRVRNGYNSNGSGPRPAQTARECSYSEFLKCKPLDFKGTEGVVGLTRWFEKMESVFSISNCTSKSRTIPNQQQQIRSRTQAGLMLRQLVTGSHTKVYALCSKCNFHHEAGPYPPRCSNYNRVGHLARDWQWLLECGAQGHLKKLPEIWNNNDRGNQAGNNRAPAKDLPGLPTTRQVDFQLIGTAARNRSMGTLSICAPERMSCRELKELSDMLYNTQFLNWGAPVLFDERTCRNSWYLMNRKNEKPPLRVRALVMTISLDLPKQILNAQTEARKTENIKSEDVRGMLIENAKFPEAIRTEKLEPRTDGTLCLNGRSSGIMYQGIKKLYIVANMKATSPPMLDKCWTVIRSRPNYETIGFVGNHRDAIKWKWDNIMRIGLEDSLVIKRVTIPFGFASNFWRSFQKALGTSLDMSTAYHPQTDRQSERTIQTLEDMLRACLQFVEEPIEITDCEVKRLKRSHIPLVKVRWNSKRGPEFMWECEDQFRKKYPHLFSMTGPS